MIGNTTQEILSKAYTSLYSTYHTHTLGYWILHHSGMDMNEHSILSKLNGSVAEEYLLRNYKDTSKKCGENT